jgi:hypothetical protein
VHSWPSGGDVAHEHPVGGLDDLRRRRGGGTGEDIDVDALGAEPRGELDHVDVHAARVTRARLVQG